MGTVRHNNLALFLKHAALTAGCLARHEPADLSHEDRKRPDVELFTVPNSTIIDVVVSNPIAPSHIQSAKKSPLKVADEAAKKKINKYRQMAEYQNADFIAFACEALGGLSPDSKRVISLIADITEHNCSWLSRADVVKNINDHIAIIIQRGNAAMVRAADMHRRLSHSNC